MTGALRHRLLITAIALVATLTAILAWSEESRHGFRILSANSEQVHGLYLVDADVVLRFSDESLEALDNGVPITIEFEARVEQERDYLWNKTVAEHAWRYQLRYHSLTQRHVITDLNTGDRHSYRARHAAINALGRIHALPLITSTELDPARSYVVRLRAGVDIEALPAPLRLPAYLSDEWDLRSEWYEWPLRSADP